MPSTGISSGSSPRMRGTLHYQDRAGIVNRFIPAHAGNSFLLAGADTTEPVHPRACGELVQPVQTGRHVIGSSPRMRGTHDMEVVARFLERFIPAHAGNSKWLRVSRRSSPVHPRACGELGSLFSGIGGFDGSSPRMRGTLPGDRPGPGSERFIPAHAGNSPSFGTGW